MPLAEIVLPLICHQTQNKIFKILFRDEFQENRCRNLDFAGFLGPFLGFDAIVGHENNFLGVKKI